MLRAEQKPVNKGMVPFYHELSNFEWVDEYCEIEDIKKELKKLKLQLKDIRNDIPSKKDFLDRAYAGYEQFQKRRIGWLARRLNRSINAKDIFSRAEYWEGAYRLGPHISWGDIEDACEMIEWPEDPQSAKERTKKI